MKWTRNLKRGMSGEDVRYIKALLLQQGLLSAATHDTFGNDTRRAVKQFQAFEGLYPSGIVDFDTWERLAGMDPAVAATQIEALIVPDETEVGGDEQIEITSEEQEEIASMAPVNAAEPSAMARMLCTIALSRVGDLYVWGASGMADLSDGAIKAKDSDAARAIKFRNAQQKAGVTGLLGHDCSGFISYLLREVGAWDKRRDCDKLWGYCTPIQRGELIAGDFLFRHEKGNLENKTHIGLYIGRGLAVHAKGRDVGVVVEGIDKGGSGYWHLYGRCKLLYKEG